MWGDHETHDPKENKDFIRAIAERRALRGESGIDF
jgi:hypothetical protein